MLPHSRKSDQAWGGLIDEHAEEIAQHGFGLGGLVDGLVRWGSVRVRRSLDNLAIADRTDQGGFHHSPRTTSRVWQDPHIVGFVPVQRMSLEAQFRPVLAEKLKNLRVIVHGEPEHYVRRGCQQLVAVLTQTLAKVPKNLRGVIITGPAVSSALGSGIKINPIWKITMEKVELPAGVKRSPIEEGVPDD